MKTIAHIQGDEPRDFLITVMGMPMTVLHNEASARRVTEGTSMKAYNGAWDNNDHKFISRNGMKWLIG